MCRHSAMNIWLSLLRNPMPEHFKSKNMNAMIITTSNFTVARMAVIAKRTSSDLMTGAKAMMVESLKRQMRSGVAHFLYQKKDGTLREAWGTTNKSLARKHINGNGDSREFYCTTAYFDVEKGDWRSFRWENIVEYG